MEQKVHSGHSTLKRPKVGKILGGERHLCYENSMLPLGYSGPPLVHREFAWDDGKRYIVIQYIYLKVHLITSLL
jgi:hypothetical protein